MTVSSEAAVPLEQTENSKRGWLLALLLSLATALAIISPFFWKGTPSGHDFSFHAASWMDAAAQWRDGILLPRWADGANHGFGEPRFIFYPPLSWMLGAALGFVTPWNYVPGVFIVLTQMMAGMSAFALARRWFPQRGALLGAICYAANPYALLIIYMRSDFAEQLALVFFPVLALVVLELLALAPKTVGHTKSIRRSISFLAITFAAVWLTNAPAGVMATYSLAILFVYAALTSKSWRPLIYGAYSFALGFGLAAFYLIPAVYEQRWVNISEALSSGLQSSQNFLYTVIADPEHNAFNHIASTTAVLMITLTGIFAVAARARESKSQAPALTKPVWSILLVLSVTATFLMLRISTIFWMILPELRFVQFPWRWMSILAVPFACFVASAIMLKRAHWYVSALTIAGLITVLGGTAAWLVRHTWWDSEDIPVLQEAMANDEGFEGVDEYDPMGDDHSSLPVKAARVTLLPDPRRSGAQFDARISAKIHIEHWSAEKEELRVTSRAPVLLSLRLLNYPAWRAKVNDVDVIPQQAGETSQMVLPLAGGSWHVVVRFIRTPDRTIGGIMSCCSILIALLLVVKPAKRAVR